MSKKYSINYWGCTNVVVRVLTHFPSVFPNHRYIFKIYVKILNVLYWSACHNVTIPIKTIGKNIYFIRT